MANNLGVTTGVDATIKTTDTAGVHTPHHNIDVIAAGDNNIGNVDIASIAAGDNNIGNVDIVTVPTDPFGANADAASATGSISAKLKGMATALGVTALDLGVGTGGSRTLRMAVDSSQIPTQGQAAPSASVPVVEAKFEYETVAASQTDQILGSTGAAGDYLSHLIIIPATTSPGAVSIEDGATNMTIFTGGASSVSNLVPIVIPIRAATVTGGWEVTTGADVSVFAVGLFT